MTRFNTIAIHSGEEHNPSDALVSPIYQTSTWRFGQPEDVAAAAVTSQTPNFYNRYGSPNTRQVESAIATLCGAEAAIATASGMAAISLLLLSELRPGDHIVAQNTLYPGSRTLFDTLLPEFKIEVTSVDQTDVAQFESAIRSNTRMIYVETPANPTMALTDLVAIVELARTHGIATACDNTFATPFNQLPLAIGIDFEIHSATKYLAGHSDVGAGIIAGRQQAIERLFKRHVLLGAALHPQEAWLLRRGLLTFGLRMAQHNANGMQVAEFLASHPAITQVYYPGLPSHPQRELAQHQMSGYGGIVSFELAGGRSAGRRLLQNVELIALAVSLGGVHSLITHVASTIAAPLSDAQLAAANIAPGLVRLSVGIEDAADIIADLDRALAALG